MALLFGNAMKYFIICIRILVQADKLPKLKAASAAMPTVNLTFNEAVSIIFRTRS